MVNPKMIADLKANPTKEEAELMALYETLRGYEKQAENVRREAALAKQREADERFRREQQALKKAKSPKKRKRPKKSVSDDPYTANEEYQSESDVDEDNDKYEDQSHEVSSDIGDKHAVDSEDQNMIVDDEKARQKEVEEAMGDKAKDAIAALPSLRKKAPTKDIGMDQPVSLIQSAPGGEALPTPPHDFSTSLELESSEGKELYPEVKFESIGRAPFWSPPTYASHFSEGALELELSDFDSTKLKTGPNTLMVKFSAPIESNRFSLNIAGPNHREYYDILFHFNPRQFQKGGQLIVNDKQEGIWGMGVTAPLSALPLIFGQLSSTLIIQIVEEGFDVYLDGEHCARLGHRTELPQNSCSLSLQFPSTDDYGSPEDWKVYKVWWGHKEMMAGTNLSNVVGVNSNVIEGLHPKKLFVSGLLKISDAPMIELRRAELERAFRKYGGAQGANVIVPINSSYAFVELESERMTDLALTELQSKYRMNRARRSRQERLQEEQEAEEAKANAENKDSSGWD